MIKLNDLPEIGDEAGIFAFAMTFDGYEAFGSFDAAAKSARQRKRDSLEEVRNELFMAARASRHSDSKAYLAKYEELLPYLIRFLSKQDRPSSANSSHSTGNIAHW